MSLLDWPVKENIRQIEISGLKIGGNKALSFMKENNNRFKPVVAIEIPYIVDSSYPEILRKEWGICDESGCCTEEDFCKKAQDSCADIVSV